MEPGPEPDCLSAGPFFSVAFGAGFEASEVGAEDGGAEPPFGPVPLDLPPSLALLLGFRSIFSDFVDVLISIGSSGDGADIWIVGVGIGTTRVEDAAGPSLASGAMAF